MSGPDPHVVRPKAHARCKAPQTLLTYLPLTNPTFSRFYYFWFILVKNFKENKNTHTAYLLFSNTSNDLFFPPSFFPSLFFFPFFPFPCFHPFFLSIFLLFLFFSPCFSSFSVFPFPSSKNLRRPVRAPWGARPLEARGLRPVLFVPLRGSGTGVCDLNLYNPVYIVIKLKKTNMMPTQSYSILN